MTATLACVGLTVKIGGKTVCRNLDLACAPGQVWAILGENGVGKSTLMATLAGMRKAHGGHVALDGTQLDALPHRQRARHLAWLAQHDDTPFPATVMEQVLVGRHPYLDRMAWESEADEAIARQALATVDLAGLENRDVATLSGGERRRVALAAVLAQQTPVLLLDEPLSQIDLRHQIALLSLLHHLARDQRRSVVLITHEPNHAARYATHALLLMGEGKCLAGPVADVLTAPNLSALYRCAITALPTADGALFLPAALGDRHGAAL